MKELLYLKDEQLKHLIEKLFISYRETFSDSKKILNKYQIRICYDSISKTQVGSCIHLVAQHDKYQ